MDLAKAYDRVDRKRLMDKLYQILPQNLARMASLFLQPIQVRTKGDVTSTTIEYKAGVTQGGPSSPMLFKIFIDDLAKRIKRISMDFGRLAIRTIKLVADDVILLSTGEIAMRIFLQICSDWATVNRLQWSPPKCSIISRSADPRGELHGVLLQTRRQGKYLGLRLTYSGFRAEDYDVLLERGQKAIDDLCYSSWWCFKLNPEAMLHLFSTNVRSKVLYGAFLLRDTSVPEKLDRELLTNYLKRWLDLDGNRPLADTNVERLLYIWRYPDAGWVLKKAAYKFVEKLKSQVSLTNDKVKDHAIRSLKDIDTLDESHILRKATNDGNPILDWQTDLLIHLNNKKDRYGKAIFAEPGNRLPGNKPPKLTHKSKNPLASSLSDLPPKERKSAFRWYIHRFPTKDHDPKPEDLVLLKGINKIHLMTTLEKANLIKKLADLEEVGIRNSKKKNSVAKCNRRPGRPKRRADSVRRF